MKKLICLLASVIALQNLYGDSYLYDTDITTDTGEIIKAGQYSKRFDGLCKEMKDGYIKSINNEYYETKLSYLQDRQKAQSLPLKTDKANGWRYKDLCEVNKERCTTGGEYSILYRLYIFENQSLDEVYKKIRNYTNYMSKDDAQNFADLIPTIPKNDFQEIVMIQIDYEGRRCYMHDDKTLWIPKQATIGWNNFAFFQTPKGVEVLLHFTWGFNYD